MKALYKIGDWVIVRATVDFQYDESNNRIYIRNLLTEEEQFTGQIVGACYRFLGKYTQGGSEMTFNGYIDCDPPYLSIDKSVLVWKVTRGILNAPVEALQKDIYFDNTIHAKGLPFKYTNPLPWNEKSRCSLREEVRNMPRDKKGKWVKV